MKRYSLIILIIVLASGLIFNSCAAPEPAPAPAKPIELKLAHHVPPVSSAGKALESWAKKVEEESGGKVQITIYPVQTLVKGPQFYTSTVDGISDITFGVNVMDASRFLLNSIMDLPVMGWPNSIVATRVWEELFNEFPEMREEFKDVKVLFRCASIPRQLHLTKKEARIPEDIKGLKIIATGPSAKALEALGASPVPMLPPDYYMALERGVAEGVCVDYTVIHDHEVIPLLPYHTELDLSYLGQELIMNLDSWNRLPVDVQKVIADLEPWGTEEFLRRTDAATVGARGACLELGHTIITPTLEELKLWYGSASVVNEKWIADNEAKGLPAKAIFERAQQLIEEYSK